MVPDGWSTVRLGEVFENRRTRGAPGLPTFSVTLNDGLVERESLERKTDTNLSPEEHLRVEPGDIAYNMMRMWQGASGLASHAALVSPAYVVLKPTPKIDPLYAAYLFKSSRMIYLFWAYSYGLTSDRLRLYYDDFALIPVAIPPIDEQRQIARVLGIWDRAIEATEKLIAASEAQKQGLMQKLLDVDPVNVSRQYSEWEIVSLDDLGQFFSGLTYSPDDTYDESGMLVLRSSNVQDGQLDFLDNIYVRPDIKVSTLTCAGDIIICVRNGSRNLIGKSAQVSPSEQGHAHGAFMSLFRPNDPLLANQLFKTTRFKALVHKNLGATINSINTSDMRRFEFAVPKGTDRLRVSEILDAQDAATLALSKSVDQLRAEKAALLQQLLTGERRVETSPAREEVA